MLSEYNVINNNKDILITLEKINQRLDILEKKVDGLMVSKKKDKKLVKHFKELTEEELDEILNYSILSNLMYC